MKFYSESYPNAFKNFFSVYRELGSIHGQLARELWQEWWFLNDDIEFKELSERPQGRYWRRMLDLPVEYTGDLEKDAFVSSHYENIHFKDIVLCLRSGVFFHIRYGFSPMKNMMYYYAEMQISEWAQSIS